MKLQTPKGFRDFLPQDALKRQFVLDKIKATFARFGFDPLDTPTLEYAETLKGKYGEEEKLIYQFKTPGGDEVALRYDQTVPLARVVAQYGQTGAQLLPIPFKRYQIQDAYRGENPQKGRYRQFLQCDADIVGVSSPLADAEILALVYEIYQDLGLEVEIKMNDRTLLQDIEPKYLSVMDKLSKIGLDGVTAELRQRGLSGEEATALLEKVQNLPPTDNLSKILNLYKELGYPENSVQFDPTLVRGLDYYTGMIVEAVLKAQPNSSSLGGGGRYDKLIGKFSGTDQPATGFSVGLERTIEAMSEAGLLELNQTKTKALVTVFSSDLLKNSLTVAAILRQKDINTEVWLEPEEKLEKQLKYADKKGVPYVVIIGPEEASKGQLVLKDLVNRTQETLSIDELISKLSS